MACKIYGGGSRGYPGGGYGNILVVGMGISWWWVWGYPGGGYGNIPGGEYGNVKVVSNSMVVGIC